MSCNCLTSAGNAANSVRMLDSLVYGYPMIVTARPPMSNPLAKMNGDVGRTGQARRRPQNPSNVPAARPR